MSNMLHIVNGDSTLEILRKTSIVGDFQVFKDMLMEGDVKPLANGSIDWKARGLFLKKRFGIDSTSYVKNMKTLWTQLERAAVKGESLTLWFEEDFFCQIHLIYLLAHLPAPFLNKGRTFVICPEKPLGIRVPESLERLYLTRLPLDKARVELAKKVWLAFASDSMAGWSALLKWSEKGKGFSIWPLLQKGLRSHLGRRASLPGGLNALEAAMLQALTNGPLGFPQFFRRTWNDVNVRPLGLGDMQIARYALDLAGQKYPLMEIKGPGSKYEPGQPINTKGWKLQLNSDGKAFFAGFQSKPKIKSIPKAKNTPKPKPKVKTKKG